MWLTVGIITVNVLTVIVCSWLVCSSLRQRDRFWLAYLAFGLIMSLKCAAVIFRELQYVGVA
jgi:hypothetical protein